MIWELAADLTNFRDASPVDNFAWWRFSESGGKRLANIWEPQGIYFPSSDEDEVSYGIPNELRPMADNVPIVTGFPIFTHKAVNALYDLIHNDVEFLELNCSEEDNQFFAVNVVRIVDCLDRQNATIVTLPGNIQQIWIHAFKPNCLDNIHIFRLVDDLIAKIYVSDRFKQVVEEKKLNGFKFIELSGMLYW